VVSDPKLVAVEVVEFDPTHDVDEKTEKLVANILEIVAAGAMKV
jgi:arginase family enzyme